MSKFRLCSQRLQRLRELLSVCCLENRLTRRHVRRRHSKRPDSSSDPVPEEETRFREDRAEEQKKDTTCATVVDVSSCTEEVRKVAKEGWLEQLEPPVVTEYATEKLHESAVKVKGSKSCFLQ